MSSPVLDPPLDVLALAALHDIQGHNQSATASAVQIVQTEHRINLINYWSITPGESVLELGCGQGDTTTVLAAAVGNMGHVVAVDPASLDYGSPFTLGQAQAHLKSTVVGPRISFLQQDPVAHLSSLPTTGAPTYTTAILSHMTYYLSTRGHLLSILTALKPHASRLCLAEHSLSAPNSRPESFPHILAVLAQATLAAHMPIESLHGNIRTVLSPEAIKEVAAEAGWKLEKEEVAPPPVKLQEGKWESDFVLNKGFAEEIEKYVEDDREKRVLYAMRDAVALSKASLSNKKVMAMDVWSAVFVPA